MYTGRWYLQQVRWEKKRKYICVLFRRQQVRCVKTNMQLGCADSYEIPKIPSGTHPFIWDIRSMWVCLTSRPPVVTDHHIIPAGSSVSYGVGDVCGWRSAVTDVTTVWVAASSVVEPASAPASVAAFECSWRHGCWFRERFSVIVRPLEEVSDCTLQCPQPAVVAVGSYNPQQYNNWTTQIS